MTSITIMTPPGEVEVRAHGHSTDPQVCAAVSMLICALMERLERQRDDFDELHVSYGSGEAEIYARGGAALPTALHCVEMVECGCSLLNAAFPGFVRLVREP